IWGGIALSWLGGLLGAVVMFCLGRTLGRGALRRWVKPEHQELIDQISREKGFQILLVARLFPLTSLDILSFAAGRVLPSPEPREVVRLHRRKPELFRFVVQPDEDGIPLAQLLRGRVGMSRGMIRRLKREPSVFSNGEAIPLRHRVRAGETITLLLPAAPESGVLAEQIGR